LGFARRGARVESGGVAALASAAPPLASSGEAPVSAVASAGVPGAVSRIDRLEFHSRKLPTSRAANITTPRAIHSPPRLPLAGTLVFSTSRCINCQSARRIPFNTEWAAAQPFHAAASPAAHPLRGTTFQHKERGYSCPLRPFSSGLRRRMSALRKSQTCIATNSTAFAPSPVSQKGPAVLRRPSAVHDSLNRSPALG
jgi:hypothetical protein